ncbi:MAG: hypothetical protein U9N56_03185 [Actinomycetota bacterium]|nr:hypothetical protein [Actinomycetota bacterium]
MGTQVKPDRRTKRFAVAMVIVAGLIASAFAASAASLGGINSADLSAWSDTVTISVPPVFLASDSFTGCTSTLDGWVDSVGNPWTSHEGDWQCLAGDVARNHKRFSVGHASVDIGVYDNISVSTDITRISTQKGKSGAGLALFSDGTYFISVIYKRDQDRLVLGVNAPSGFRELMEVDPISDLDSGTLTVQIQQPILTVLINGSVVMTFDLTDTAYLSAEEQDLLLENTRFGLASDNDNWSRYADFTIVALP